MTGAEFEVYPGEDGQHYWRLKAPNGQVIATGAEGYSSKGATFRAVGSVQSAVVGIAAQAALDQSELAAKEAEATTPA